MSMSIGNQHDVFWWANDGNSSRKLQSTQKNRSQSSAFCWYKHSEASVTKHLQSAESTDERNSQKLLFLKAQRNPSFGSIF